MDGVQTKLETRTAFWQTDELKGRAKSVTVLNSAGQLISQTLMNYTANALTVVQPTYSATVRYQGITRFWVVQSSQENRSYTSDGTRYQASKTEYTYEPTYGNNTGSKQSTCADPYEILSAGQTCPAWAVQAQSETNYAPAYITSALYLVGLPIRVITRDGTGAVLSRAENAYDTSLNPNDPAVVGKLTSQRIFTDSNQYRLVRYEYDAWGNPYKTIGYETTFSDNGDLPPIAGQATRSTQTTFDNQGVYPIQQSMGMGMTSSIAYDNRFGAPIRETGPNGQVTSAEYDSLGRITKVWYPQDALESPSLTMVYHDGNPFWTEIIQRVDSNNTLNIRRYYDGLGRTVQVCQVGVKVDGAIKDIVVDYYYNNSGQLSKQTIPYAVTSGSAYNHPSSPTNPTTSTYYNDQGQPIQVTGPDGSTVQYQYGVYESAYAALGLVNKVIDNKGVVTKSVVNNLGQTVLVVPATGPVIGYVYDNAGRMTKAIRATLAEVLGCITNNANAASVCPAAKTIRLNYNFAGQKTSMVDPDMGTWFYEYDAWGNLRWQKDARQCELTLTYDDLNRLLRKDSSGTGCNTQVHTEYKYDEGGLLHKGLRTSMIDASGTTSWQYDERGRITQESKMIALPNDTFSSATTRTTYNNANQPVTITYPGGEVVTNTYNAQGILEKVSSSIGVDYASFLSYDAAGRLTSRTFGSGLTQKLKYYAWTTPNGGGKLEKMVTGSGTWNASSFSFASNLQNLAYIYDEVGNISMITDLVANETQSYTYDTLYRLTNWDVYDIGSASPKLQEGYQYDAAGNLFKKNNLTLTYNDAAHAHAVSSTSTGNSYQYDANGSQTQRTVNGKVFNLGYDAENRLVSVSSTEMTASFTYDGDGKQVKSVITPAGGPAETTLYFGPHYEIKNPGAGQVISKYYFAGGSRVAMRKYTIPQSMTVEYFLTDHLGSTAITTNATGAKVSEMKYKPWGETRSTWTDTDITATVSPIYQPTRYTFTGQRSYTSDFGLHFYNARWYDSETGRFAQADTIVPGGVQGLDRYAYVSNNPVNRIDPSGHYDCSAIPSSDGRAACESENNEFKDQPGCGLDGSTPFGFHCTKDDMDKATLEQRQQWFSWLQKLMNKNSHDKKLGAMFGNISTVLAGFKETGQDDNQWVKDVDAAILLAVQDGFANSFGLYKGEVTLSIEKWTIFFDAYKNRNVSKQTLIQLWGDAEQQATDDGIVQAGQPTGLDDKLFVFIGNIYRGAGHTICTSIDCSKTGFEGALGFFSPDTEWLPGMSPVAYAQLPIYVVDTVGYIITGH